MLTAFLKVVLVYFFFVLYFFSFLPLTGAKQNLTRLNATISAISVDAWPTVEYLSDRTFQTSALTLITC